MKSVLITGASSGIGQATAHRFHKAGYFVYLLARDKIRLENLHQQLPQSKIIICDLSDPKQIASLGAEIDFGRLTVLINNAGIYFMNSTDQHSSTDWTRMFQINLFAIAQLSSMVLPYFKSNKGGAIINVSSTLGQTPVPNTSAYSASKAAVQSFTKTLALEAASYGIRVNCVAPGIVETPIHNLDKLNEADKTMALDRLNKLQPLARIGQPNDIAEAIYFLASDASSWTTGAILDVDGGINI